MSNLRLTKLIELKRNGGVLSGNDVEYFVLCVVKSMKNDESAYETADRSQIGAMLMAIYFQGLNADETFVLTESMKNSGYVFSWPSDWKHLVVDKHSTGGVGDKVSLILTPALAALGLKVPMISGRTLGHTGGTLDKMESIPGYRVNLSTEEIYRIIDEVGCCIVGQTDDCVPADKVLYQCRDITATIDCSPLIVASIVSKKLSESTAALVYDVKFGKGSFFKTKEEAIETAEKLVRASKCIKASAVLTSMENPLGKTVGNSLEVLEAIDCLKGEGPEDVLEVTRALGAEILHHVKGCPKKEGEALILNILKNGAAIEKFKSMLLGQGVSKENAQEICYGDASAVLCKEIHSTDIYYNGTGGYVQEINPLTLALWWKEEYLQSSMNRGVGIKLLKTVGEEIQAGDAWAKIHHAADQLQLDQHETLQKAIIVGSERCNRVLCSQVIT